MDCDIDASNRLYVDYIGSKYLPSVSGDTLQEDTVFPQTCS